MPLNKDFVGRMVTSSASFEVTRGDIRRFAAAIGDTNPAYRDVAAAQALGHLDLIAPPTFLITLTMSSEGSRDLINEPGLGLDYTMVVHGEEKFELHRPIQAGDLLDSTTTIASIREVGRNELMLLVTEVTSSGEKVATVSNTLVSRGSAAPRAAAPETAAPETAQNQES